EDGIRDRNVTGVQTCALPICNYVVLAGASSGQAIQGAWPSALVQGATGGLLNAWAGFPTSCPPGSLCAPVPASYQTLQSQQGNRSEERRVGKECRSRGAR